MTLPRKISKPKTKQSDRIRCQGHLAYVRSHVCSVPGCDRWPTEAAHVRTGTDGGVGIKPGDQWTLSLCGPTVDIEGHHAEQHRVGEAAFEKKYSINMKKTAEEFASRSDALKRYLARKRAA